MHYDMRLTMPKLLQVSQMAWKEYHHHADRYMSRPLLYNPFVKDEVVMVPRLIPPSSKLIPAIRELETMIGVQHSDDGRMAFRDMMRSSSRSCQKIRVPRRCRRSTTSGMARTSSPL